MKKKISLLLLLVLFSNIAPIFAADDAQVKKEAATLGYDQYMKGKYSYYSNVSNFCLGNEFGGDYWNFDTSKQLVVKHDKSKYPDLSITDGGLSFDDIHKRYIDTMDNIMNCAVLKSKYALNKKIIDDYKISDRSKKVLEEANTKIEQQIQEQKCIAPRKGDKIYNGKDLLDSMSYEQCVYHMYLFYYKNVCGNNIGTCAAGKKPQTYAELSEVVTTEGKKLKNENQISDEAFDTALSLYENFERTYIAHVLLQLILVEVTEDKRFVGTTIKAIEEFVSLAKNAQKSTADS